MEAANSSGTAAERGWFELLVLDLPGFEQLERNGLEQFLSHYANEALHQVFVTCLFKDRLSHFIAQGVPVSALTDAKFQCDNLDVMNSFQGGWGGSEAGRRARGWALG